MAIIDPLRETTPYLKRVEKDGAKVKYIFETHFHADFVSGHLELSEKTGAPIVYGEGAKADFDFIEAKDGQEFQLGDYTIRALHTPGHTPGGVCFLVEDALISGDTLFAGSIGRTDLPGGSYNQLLTSIREKLFPLDDNIRVYSGHGPATTIGNERKFNPFLKA